MRRFTLVRRCVSVLLLVGLSLAAREPALAVDVEVRSLSEKPLANVPVTFGQVFKKGEIAFCEDWKRLGRENARLSKPGLPNYGCSYAYSARAACVCGMDAGFPKAAEAVRFLEANLPDFKNVMAKDPHWAILPGGAAAK